MNKRQNTLHPIAISKVMINFAVNQGADLYMCLHGTGIGEQQLSDGAALIQREQEMRLVENIMLELPNVPALGFRIGLSYNVATFGIWGFSLRTCRTLRDALTMALRFLPLSTAYSEISAFDTGECFSLRLNAQGIPIHLRQFFLERDMAAAINIVKELSLNEVQQFKTEFSGPSTDNVDIITQVCGASPEYQRGHNAIFIPIEYVDKPLSTYDASLAQMLTAQCQRQLRQRQIGGIAGDVRQQILGGLGFTASLNEVADALAMSSRTLRRKLDKQETSFRAVVEEERRLVAYELLEHSDIKIDELALHLGYNDTSSFNRAFKRWAGNSPSAYRESLAKLKT